LPLNLDFIYGSMESHRPSDFLPLDGQQRLTTLFLLHWYMAWRDGQHPQFESMLCGRQRSVTKKQRSSRVLTRVLSVCLPIFIRT
jgi:hypothetical protein